MRAQADQGPGRPARRLPSALPEPVPELYVLLTGPARGYVRSGLDRLGIPYRHLLLPDVDAVAPVYSAIDVCLVASRDEGGPRAVLESMASRVPLVTTRVGQAADLVRHGENGWMVEPEDVEGLVAWTLHVAGAPRSDLERGPRRGTGRLRRTTRTLPCDRAGGRCSTASWRSRGVMDASAARAGRYGRAAVALGAAASREDGPTLGSASSTATIAFPRPASARRGARSRSRSSPRVSRTRLSASLSSTSGRPGFRATSARSSHSCGAAGFRSS